MTPSTALSKSILHNLVVVAVGFGVALLGKSLDSLLTLSEFRSWLTTITGVLLLSLGFALRVWATYHFYEHRMKVISLVPQNALITSGPYAFSRNPLYLGGNVFVFFGAALLLGSPGALAITTLHLPFMDWFIRREEGQLEQSFGDEWIHYTHRVRRWL